MPAWQVPKITKQVGVATLGQVAVGPRVGRTAAMEIDVRRDRAADPRSPPAVRRRRPGPAAPRRSRPSCGEARRGSSAYAPPAWAAGRAGAARNSPSIAGAALARSRALSEEAVLVESLP